MVRCYVTYKVESYYTAVVDVADVDEAESMADYEFEHDYFGDAYDVTGHIVKIECETPDREWVEYEE